ncbi:hypothetical protein TNCV_3338241 [Trichonephila clavipes]|nr:hypothetical protein TNCV_3338241 [Trichonephila clavipes]
MEGIKNSRRAASSFVRLVEGEETWKNTLTSQGILPQNRDRTELNRTVACTMLKATGNDRCTFNPFGPASHAVEIRLKWSGHLARMNEGRYSKKTFLAKPMGNIPLGRPPFKWIDCVEKNLNILKVKNWKTVAKSKDAWRKFLKKCQGPPRAIVEELTKNLFS